MVGKVEIMRRAKSISVRKSIVVFDDTNERVYQTALSCRTSLCDSSRLFSWQGMLRAPWTGCQTPCLLTRTRGWQPSTRKDCCMDNLMAVNRSRISLPRRASACAPTTSGSLATGEAATSLSRIDKAFPAASGDRSIHGNYSPH